jgi:lysophospholipase L1-like esterase
MASSKSLNILCFGDSLTAGYSAYGMRFTPYSTWLKTMLEEELTGVKKVNVDTDGVSGELVLRGFRGRMEKRCASSFPLSLSQTHIKCCDENKNRKSTSKERNGLYVLHLTNTFPLQP